MGLLAQYGSDSDSDSDSGPQTVTPATTTATVPKKRPVKIGFNHPILGNKSDKDRLDETDEPDENDSKDTAKPAPKSQSTSGKKSSALLAMLPPPKRSGGSKSNHGAAKSNEPRPSQVGHLIKDQSQDSESTPQISLVPRGVKRSGSPKAKSSGPLDLFGLDSASTPSTATTTSAPSVDSAPPISITSAPPVTEFKPPVPTPQDPYPGYYQLPSGEWAAHDPKYYHSIYATWTPGATTDANGRMSQRMIEKGAMGHAWQDLDATDPSSTTWDVKSSLEASRQAAAESTAPTTSRFPPATAEGTTPYRAAGRTTGLAGKRHQLSALLKDAHTNRQALEDRIAQNKRTKRESGTKYGF